MRWAIVAHPDDEVIFAGGAMLSHAGEPWTVVVATQTEDSPRAAESLAARDSLRALGLEIDYRFLGHTDVQFHTTGGIDTPALARQLSELGVGPGERVYTHGSPGEYGHNGHKAVHRSVVQALGGLASLSVFSGGGEIVERIVDPGLLAEKSRLFNAAYPSQRGVWSGLAHTMIEVTSEERHFALSPLDDALADSTNPLQPRRPQLVGQGEGGALAAAVFAQIASLREGTKDALVIAPDASLLLEAVGAKAAGRIDVVGGLDADAYGVDPATGVRVLAQGIDAWTPGERLYDLLVCFDLLPAMRDFDLVFQWAGRSLRPGGQAVFTHEPLIEGHPEYGRAYVMDEGPRYRRPVQSVLDLARRHGLKVRAIRDLAAGRRFGEPVIHQLVRLEHR